MFTIDKKFAHANVARTVRFTETMFKQLCDLADSEDVSFNNLVLQCCAYALEEYGGRSKEETSQNK